jgi:creatinine amidohydrolase
MPQRLTTRDTFGIVHGLDALTARELQRLIDGAVSTVVLPFGSIEHQGGHLPLGADAILADAVATEVTRRLDAVLAPTLRVGCSEQHLHRPGTVSLSAATLKAIAVDQTRSLARQGFTVVVLLSTNGGNEAALDAAVVELGASLSTVQVRAPRGDVGPNPGSRSGCWLTSVMLALRPDLVRLDAAQTDLAIELETANAGARPAAHRALRRQHRRRYSRVARVAVAEPAAAYGMA